MTAAIRRCPDHGPFVGDCPVCGANGTLLLSGERRRRLSKFMSGALRHFPGDVGLTLDDRGWTSLPSVTRVAEDQYEWAMADHVTAVIATDPKGRFERTHCEGTAHVRAAYGHSVDVSLEPTDAPVPDELFHGTAPSTLASIRASGLRPMGRQEVHLSGDRETALAVGRRHAASPAVLRVDAAGLLAAGHRITKRGRGIYTTSAVPPAYVTADDGSP